MNTPIYNIVHDEDDVLGLNPLIVYFFFTEETSRYKPVMANPCDNRRIFSFECLDKRTEMAHILQGTELGNAIKDCNMLVRLFTENGRNDDYFVANIPYEGIPRGMRSYARILMNEVYDINQRNISSRLEKLDKSETDIRSLLTFVLDNLNRGMWETTYAMVGSEVQEEFDRNIAFPEFNDHDDSLSIACYKNMDFPAQIPVSRRSRTAADTERKKISRAKNNKKKDLLEQVKAKARQISNAAKTMEVNELEQLLRILSDFNSSVEDSNDIAAGIFDEEKSDHLTYQICMSRKPKEDYDITIKVSSFETEGKQRKKIYGLVVTVNGMNFYIHFTSTDSCMLYVTTLSRMKYNIALTHEDMIIKKNFFERKKKNLADMQSMYKYLSNGSKKAFENWYLKMDDFTNRDQDYYDKCNIKQKSAVNTALGHANTDIFNRISKQCPNAMYYLGIVNKDKLNYQINIQKDRIELPDLFTRELDVIYSKSITELHP